MKMFLFRHQKVKSGVLRLRRKKDYSLPWGEIIFTVVKTAFQRRKTMRNSLKTMNLI
jgi:16S rRNA (adenine1518-N6/adenine1519-N6)-dimethyltransferase